jgi:hypothetical protein
MNQRDVVIACNAVPQSREPLLYTLYYHLIRQTVSDVLKF